MTLHKCVLLFCYLITSVIVLVLHLYWWKGVATLPWGVRDMPTVVVALWLLA